MNEQELKKCLNGIVNGAKNAEMKASLDTEDWVGWAKSFCAFSGGASGHVFVGVGSLMNLASIPEEDVDGVVLRANSVLEQHMKPFVDYDMRPIAADCGGEVLQGIGLSNGGGKPHWRLFADGIDVTSRGSRSRCHSQIYSLVSLLQSTKK